MRQSLISHALPGRIRLRHPVSLSPAACAELTERVRAVAPSAALEYSPHARSTLVRFAEKDLSPRVLALFSKGSQAPPAPCRGAVGLPVLHWPHMRQVKRGMAVSLVASLGLLAARRETAHAVTGGVFLGLLARHLWVYRRRLWK